VKTLIRWGYFGNPLCDVLRGERPEVNGFPSHDESVGMRLLRQCFHTELRESILLIVIRERIKLKKNMLPLDSGRNLTHPSPDTVED
jgi:hypothetical protein